ncbi:hypothetical protein IPC782_14785 [Pseudomonas aeruginosa]|uniref:hypothetical protein n=1 Tax=Pseudomonas aeruginosa TaxID=287 RepID=UPI000F53065A|nr:hypothetical protein [Pseudomonas aeruginosa]RPV86540.1 hypothetical protein IPC782_14785 [Pseudomonas aeruginosa]
MSSTQHQLIEQCATRLRGIVDALDNIHDTSPHRWSTDLDDVHSSAESLLALIKDHAPPSEDQLIATGLSYPLAKGLAGTPLRDAPASVEQAGGDRWDALQSIMEWTAAENIPDDRKLCLIRNAARAALAHAPTSSASPSCKWTESSGIWETGCGQTWSFIEDGPAENGALFCHHCGGRLVLIKSDDQEDDGHGAMGDRDE